MADTKLSNPEDHSEKQRLHNLHQELLDTIGKDGPVSEVEDKLKLIEPDDLCQICMIHSGSNRETLLHQLLNLDIGDSKAKVLELLMIHMNKSEAYCIIDVLQQGDGFENGGFDESGGDTILHKAARTDNAAVARTLMDNLAEEIDRFLLINTHNNSVDLDECPPSSRDYDTALHLAGKEITKLCLESISCEEDRVLLMLAENEALDNIVFQWIRNDEMMDYILNTVVQTDEHRLKLLCSTNSIRCYGGSPWDHDNCLHRAMGHEYYKVVDIIIKSLQSKTGTHLVKLALTKNDRNGKSAAFMLRSPEGFPYMKRLMDCMNSCDKVSFVTRDRNSDKPTVFHGYFEDFHTARYCYYVDPFYPQIVKFYLDAFSYSDCLELLRVKSSVGLNAIQVAYKLGDAVVQVHKAHLKPADFSSLIFD